MEGTVIKISESDVCSNGISNYCFFCRIGGRDVCYFDSVKIEMIVKWIGCFCEPASSKSRNLRSSCTWKQLCGSVLNPWFRVGNSEFIIAAIRAGVDFSEVDSVNPFLCLKLKESKETKVSFDKLVKGCMVGSAEELLDSFRVPRTHPFMRDTVAAKKHAIRCYLIARGWRFGAKGNVLDALGEEHYWSQDRAMNTQMLWDEACVKAGMAPLHICAGGISFVPMSQANQRFLKPDLEVNHSYDAS